MSRPRHTGALALGAEVVEPPPGQHKGEWLRSQLRDLAQLMSPGELFPSDRVLADRYRVARMTVRAQLDELVEQGLLERKPGRGTFVRRPDAVLGERLQSFTTEMQARGLQPSSEILVFRRSAANAGDRRIFGLDAGAKVLHVVRVRRADDVPMALERVRLPDQRVPGLTRAGLADRSLYELLAAEYGIVAESADQTITVDWPPPVDLALLDLPAGSATLHVERVTRDGMGRVIEHGRSIYRADRYQVQMHVGVSVGR
jgi:GntR family transcriptional regulator